MEASYAVTAWTRAVEDEHRLLSQVLALLYAHPTVPEDVLNGTLAGQDHQRYPLDATIGRSAGRRPILERGRRPVQGLARLRRADGVRLGTAVERGPEVRTQTVRLGTDAGRGSMEELHRIGGTVRAAGGDRSPTRGSPCLTTAADRERPGRAFPLRPPSPGRVSLRRPRRGRRRSRGRDRRPGPGRRPHARAQGRSAPRPLTAAAAWVRPRGGSPGLAVSERARRTARCVARRTLGAQGRRGPRFRPWAPRGAITCLPRQTSTRWCASACAVCSPARASSRRGGTATGGHRRRGAAAPPGRRRARHGSRRVAGGRGRRAPDRAGVKVIFWARDELLVEVLAPARQSRAGSSAPSPSGAQRAQPYPGIPTEE